MGWPQVRKRTKTGSIKQNQTHEVESLNIIKGSHLIVTQNQNTESRLQQKTKHLRWNHIQVTLWRIFTGESQSGVTDSVSSGLIWHPNAVWGTKHHNKNFLSNSECLCIVCLSLFRVPCTPRCCSSNTLTTLKMNHRRQNPCLSATKCQNRKLDKWSHKKMVERTGWHILIPKLLNRSTTTDCKMTCKYINTRKHWGLG